MSDLRVAIAGAGGRMGAGQYPGRRRDARPRRSMPRSTARARRPSAAMRANSPAPAARRRHRRRCRSRARRRRRRSSISPRRPSASCSPSCAAQRGLVHIIGTTGCSEKTTGPSSKAALGRRAHRQVRQFLARRQRAGRPRAAGGEGPARLRYRNPRDAPQQEGRCALGHGADAGPGRGRRPRHRSRPARRPRRATATPARATPAASALRRCAAAA